MKLTDNFELHEFVNPWFYHRYGNHCVSFINPNLAPTCQKLKDMASAETGDKEVVTLNNWLWGGKYTNSGLRRPNSSVGVEDSMHKQGNTGDAKFKIMSVKQVFEMVMDNQDQFPNIWMIENIRYTKSKYGHLGRDWFHFAVSSLPVDKIHVFKP